MLTDMCQVLAVTLLMVTQVFVFYNITIHVNSPPESCGYGKIVRFVLSACFVNVEDVFAMIAIPSNNLRV